MALDFLTWSDNESDNCYLSTVFTQYFRDHGFKNKIDLYKQIKDNTRQFFFCKKDAHKFTVLTSNWVEADIKRLLSNQH